MPGGGEHHGRNLRLRQPRAPAVAPVVCATAQQRAKSRLYLALYPGLDCSKATGTQGHAWGGRGPPFQESKAVKSVRILVSATESVADV